MRPRSLSPKEGERERGRCASAVLCPAIAQDATVAESAPSLASGSGRNGVRPIHGCN
jgi:hypothetical protein